MSISLKRAIEEEEEKECLQNWNGDCYLAPKDSTRRFDTFIAQLAIEAANRRGN